MPDRELPEQTCPCHPDTHDVGVCVCECSEFTPTQRNVVKITMQSGVTYHVGPLTDIASRRYAETQSSHRHVRSTERITMLTPSEYAGRNHDH